ncbi:hypothetical protein [Burkholderia pyrrocinia]|uniref:hypothetical protein n=1 Tax=Burkholderia pyrrocinia TaxID=60550 RepID=UPI00104CD1EB|nr:hypothetical protein [Burkholderia pyrrocinia]TDA48960.1 hypothetical protein EVG18_02475 [Burkholderia pyrrocinia]
MKTSTLCSGLIAPALAQSQVVNLTGKTKSKTTAYVTPRDVLTVADDKGGWFESRLEMRQTGGWTMPYEGQARLKILSTSEDSVGYHTVDISAYPPEEDFKSTAGIYGGVLSMRFEPVVKAP